ncbi:MAG: FtsX-like permease family protein [Bacteroidia bacterium]|nr:FtsX-like permease family protein [Bacteroidia bacterium]
MLQSYFKLAIRNLIQNKTYSLINVVGLSISLAVFFLMFLWVKDEYSTDQFHEKGDRLYRVKRTVPLENNVLDVINGVSFPLLNAAVEELPEVEAYITLGQSFEDNLRIGDEDFRAQGTFTNADFFESFSYPVLIGDIKQLDEKRESIAISENLAERIFGQKWREKALGEVISILDNGDFSVEAVYADFPSNSSLQNDFYYSFFNYLDKNEWMEEWGNNGMFGALRLVEGANPTRVGEKLQAIFQANISGDEKEGCLLQKYGDHYLYGQFDERAQISGGRIEYVQTFSLAALLLLIISSINFVNLATVIATKRAREVGVRKVLGAHKKTLVGQFMTEAAIITLISVVLALLFARLLLPEVNELSDKLLSMDVRQPIFVIGILLIYFLTTLLTGAYPSFIMSSFRPINVLKSKSNSSGIGSSVRKGLVIIQFALSLMLILGAVVVQNQIQYIHSKNLGISKDNMISIHQDESLTKKYSALKQKLENSMGIEGVSLVGPSPLNIVTSTSGVSWPGKRLDQEHIEFSMVWTAQNFPEVFDIPLVAGSYYREGQKIDTTYIVLNETAISIMGIEEPIGKTIQWWGAPREIAGVVKDFHNRSMHDKIAPTAFLLEQDDAGWMYVKAHEGEMPIALNSVQAAFKEILPDLPLHYDFLLDQYKEMYAAEMLTARLANYFAIISIFISCLGLFGLISFIGQERTKEISIRKVLGASVASIVALLSKDFIKLIAIAILIAFPLGWIFMNKWLESFEYQLPISIWVFTSVAIAALLIAMLTISFQTFKAALSNPVDSLKTE